jgi:hypothetical protein
MLRIYLRLVIQNKMSFHQKTKRKIVENKERKCEAFLNLVLFFCPFKNPSDTIF